MPPGCVFCFPVFLLYFVSPGEILKSEGGDSFLFCCMKPLAASCGQKRRAAARQKFRASPRCFGGRSNSTLADQPLSHYAHRLAAAANWRTGWVTGPLRKGFVGFWMLSFLLEDSYCGDRGVRAPCPNPYAHPRGRATPLQ